VSSAARRACPSCGTALTTPLLCESCSTLLAAPAEASPWELLGLERSFPIDRKALEKRRLALSRRMHPDFFANGTDEERARAERGTSALNAAWEVLSDDARRADRLVRDLGGPRESEERQMPQEFLMEVLDWNEAIEEARLAGPGAPERAELAGLRATLAAERARVLAEVAGLLRPLPEPRSPDLVTVRRHLNAVRYFDRALREIDELRLAHGARA
jgi:molecular chaperone HscB